MPPAAHNRPMVLDRFPVPPDPPLGAAGASTDSAATQQAAEQRQIDRDASLREARDALRVVIEELDQYQPTVIQDTDGKLYQVLAIEQGEGAILDARFARPWQPVITDPADGIGFIYPGVVTDGITDHMPDAGYSSGPLDESPPPNFVLTTGTHRFYLKVVITPSVVGSAEDGYAIGVGGTIAETPAILTGTSGAAVAEVDPETGTTTDGTYFIHLATVVHNATEGTTEVTAHHVRTSLMVQLCDSPNLLRRTYGFS